MAAESPIRILDNDGSHKWSSVIDPPSYTSPFNHIVVHEGFTEILRESGVLREEARVGPSRSGSAPPTIEGSLSAFRSLAGTTNSTIEFSDYKSEELMRTDLDYIAYYYANVRLNPRLPPPLLSRESRQRVRLMGYLGSKGLTSMTDDFLATHREEPEEDTSIEQSKVDRKGRIVSQKNHSSSVDNRGLVDLKQETNSRAPSPTSGIAVEGENSHDIHTIPTDQVSEIQESCSGSNDVQTVNCPEPISPRHRNADLDDNISTQSNIGSDYNTVESRMKSLNVQLHDTNRVRGHLLLNTPLQVHVNPKMPGLHPLIPNSGLVPPLYAATASYMNSGNLNHPNLPLVGFPYPQFSVGGFSGNSVFNSPNLGGYLQGNAFPVSVDGHLNPGSFKQPIEVINGMNPYPYQMMMRPSYSQPLPRQYVHQPFGQLDVHGLQKGTYPPYSIGVPANAGHLRVNYYGHPPRIVMPDFHVRSPVLIPGSPMAGIYRPGSENDMNIMQHSPGNMVSNPWGKGQRFDSYDDSKRHSYLELLKSSNSRKLELSDISGQIAELSSDQHGSRFIQQKLEYCGVDEKEYVFKEVLPHASKLIIDVFGNYVIQKFFEHGTVEHRRKLGQQLTGQIVALSLQMYGCRVIQKALEVIELDQKVELVRELDGHVIKCVHDQNGNHVIQKCIESIPTKRIGFIISSFYGQVASLSSHPYGCRVIQRVLEHCSDEELSRCIVDEILESACTLAQDPYGNYVTQHILEKGNPQERSQIISKLTGIFVQMSQHKYASNVVEKCLKYGDASEQDLIIEEIIAQPENDETLFAMMKDQFANYVVQRIFNVGNDKQRDVLVNCIRNNLPALKRFPYAKHLVARYEQLSEGSTEEQK